MCSLACFHYRPLVDIVFWTYNILEPSGRKKWGAIPLSKKVGGPDPKLRLCQTGNSACLVLWPQGRGPCEQKIISQGEGLMCSSLKIPGTLANGDRV